MPKISIILVAVSLVAADSALAQVNMANPKTARDFYERGYQHEKSRRWDEALADYKKAGELDPGLFDAHFSRSSLSSAMKDYPAAIEALKLSLKARPKSYSALFNLGGYFERLRNYDEAIAYYTQASAEDANFSYYGSTKNEGRALAYHYRGRIYQWHKKDNAKAVADYTAALRLDPDIRMVRYRRARAYHDLGEYAKAHSDFAAALELDPDYPNLLNAWAWQLATCPEDKFRDGELALRLAKQTRHQETLAAAYAETGAYNDAIAAQQRAIEQLNRGPEPKDDHAAILREEQRMQMQKRLATYEAKRPYRDE